MEGNEFKPKKIGIVAPSHEKELHYKFLEAIKVCESKGDEVVILDSKSIESGGFHIDTLIKDEITYLSKYDPISLPETRKERRARKRKYKNHEKS